MTSFTDAIADVKNGPTSHPLYNVVEIAFKAVWTIRDAATVSRTLRKAEASRYEYLANPWDAIGDELYSEDFAELRGWLQTTVAEYRRILRAARGSNLPDVKPAKPAPVAEPVTHYVKGRERGKRNFVFVAPNGESRLKVHAARFTLTSALAAIAELACENPGWQFKAVRIDGAKYGTFTAPIIPQPSPVSFTAPSVKVAAMAPEAAPDTCTPIRPVAEPSMNVVYDVLEHVKPGTMTSTTPGTWLVQHFATEDQAREFAARCNQCAGVPGITYEVQSIDAESPDRHQSEADYHRSQRPSIGPAPISGGSPESAPATPENAGHVETAPVVEPEPVAELPTIEIKGAAYTTEALPNGLAFIKLVNGNRHEVTWTENGVADCTCPAFYHTGSCKHADYALKAGLIPTPAPVPVLPESAPSDPCDIRPGHPEYTAEDEHARVRAIIVGAPILVYHLPESGPGRVDTLGWVVADHVSRLVEIQRDGQHGRDDSAGVGWTASLLWDAMPVEEREIFAEWVDAIGYDPTEDFAGLPADEQWDVFAGCCLTGTPVAFPVRPGSDPGPGADATIFADQSRDFVAGTAEASPSPAIFLGCNVGQGNDLHPSPPPPEVFASDPIISRAPWDAIDIIGAHAMNAMPTMSGGSPEDDEAHPWGFCYGCRQIRPLAIGTGFKLATHADKSGVKCGGSGSKAGYICSRPDDEATPPVSGGSPEEDCPCPECGGSGVAGGQHTEDGEEPCPCDLCEGTGRYSPTELPEEEYDRLVAAATPSNETLRRMIRDPKPPEATAPPDRLVEDLEGWASVMGGPRDLIPAERDDVIVALREAAEEIRRLRAEAATSLAADDQDRLLGEDGEPLVCLTREEFDGLVGAAEATINKLDYLQALWGKEGVTDSLARQLRAAIVRAKP